MCGGDGCGDDGDRWSGGSGGLRREAHESACRPCFVECEAGAVFLCAYDALALPALRAISEITSRVLSLSKAERTDCLASSLRSL